jgi:hypothetical protein
MWRWESPVPFLPPPLIESGVFLYPTRVDAEDRQKWGGSGFLVGVNCKTNPAYYVHLYIVTNEHVARSCSVARLTNEKDEIEIKDGSFDADWVAHPDRDDVAVRSLGLVSQRDYWYMNTDALLTRDALREEGIGPGDDCFMVGRYINHEGEQFDRPVVRFGNLAMLPEKIRQGDRAFDQESFLVDMRSVVGFSGSMVIVYYELPGPRKWEMPDGRSYGAVDERRLSGRAESWWLLGIDWGHLSVLEDIIEDGKKKRVKVKSSMAGVVPAWKLRELLDVDELVKAREEAEAKLAERGPFEAELDVQTPESESEWDRFEDLTRQLVQTPKPPVG